MRHCLQSYWSGAKKLDGSARANGNCSDCRNLRMRLVESVCRNAAERGGGHCWRGGGGGEGLTKCAEMNTIIQKFRVAVLRMQPFHIDDNASQQQDSRSQPSRHDQAVIKRCSPSKWRARLMRARHGRVVGEPLRIDLWSFLHRIFGTLHRTASWSFA